MAHPFRTRIFSPAFAGILLSFGASAATRATEESWPFSPRTSAPTGRPSPSPKPEEPPRDTPLVEQKWETLSNKNLRKEGEAALAIDPGKWKHAETDHFVLHYRRVTEAQKVAREVEYDLWFIAKTLDAKKEQYQRKSHVFVFEDDEEWHVFLGKVQMPAWIASFAYGDELFLNVRKTQETGRFDSKTLAHETTHAVVARLYPDQRWPLWLAEGWAEYMGGASVAARKGQSVKRHQTQLRFAAMPLETMERLTSYPADEILVAQLYQTSEKLVRYLMAELPKERILRFIEAALAGKSLQTCVLEVYGDQFKDWADFRKKFELFDR